MEDNLKPPSALGIAIEPNTETALMNSLNVRKEFRTKDAETFYKELGSDVKVERVVEEKTVKEDLKIPPWMRWGAFVPLRRTVCHRENKLYQKAD